MKREIVGAVAAAAIIVAVQVWTTRNIRAETAALRSDLAASDSVHQEHRANLERVLIRYAARMDTLADQARRAEARAVRAERTTTDALADLRNRVPPDVIPHIDRLEANIVEERAACDQRLQTCAEQQLEEKIRADSLQITYNAAVGELAAEEALRRKLEDQVDVSFFEGLLDDLPKVAGAGIIGFLIGSASP